MHCIALHCIALHCIALHCIALHCIALHCIALHCIALHCIALHCIALHCIALHCIALHCIALHCIALHCIALHCIALHCIALHCIALHCIALHCIALHCIALHCIALYCIVLYCIVLYCIVLYCIVLYCKRLSISRRRREIQQNGGFLPAWLAPFATSLSTADESTIRVNVTREEDGIGRSPAVETLRTPIQLPIDTTLHDLDSEMQSLLDKTGIDVSEGARLYNQALLRYNDMVKMSSTKDHAVSNDIVYDPSSTMDF